MLGSGGSGVASVVGRPTFTYIGRASHHHQAPPPSCCCWRHVEVALHCLGMSYPLSANLEIMTVLLPWLSGLCSRRSCRRGSFTPRAITATRGILPSPTLTAVVVAVMELQSREQVGRMLQWDKLELLDGAVLTFTPIVFSVLASLRILSRLCSGLISLNLLLRLLSWHISSLTF